MKTRSLEITSRLTAKANGAISLTKLVKIYLSMYPSLYLLRTIIVLAHIKGLKRCGKSCRLRWKNYLRPGIKRGNISSDEEELIIRLHNLLGNRFFTKHIEFFLL